MGKKSVRPVNLDFRGIYFSLTGLVSVLQRISGVLCIGLVGILLWQLNLSLSSPESFTRVAVLAGSPAGKCLIWIMATLLVFHTLSGLRHMVIEFSVWNSRNAVRISAISVLLMTVAVSLFVAGVLLC